MTGISAAIPVEHLRLTDMLDSYDATFEAARAHFVALCEELGLDRCEHPIGTGHDSLCIAHLGPRDCARKLVVLSGVHGVEGFAGSAAQIVFLERYRRARPIVHVLLVHVVNPDGMRRFRRAAPGNVDLNRNLVDDYSARARVDEESREVGRLMSSARLARVPGPLWLLWLALRLPGLGGIAKLREVLAAGQYFDPAALFYGGAMRAGEVEALLCALHLSLAGCNPGDVVFFDLHAGIGPFGRPALFANGGDRAAAADLFGAPVGQGHHGEGAVFYPVQGDLVRGVTSALGLSGACAVTFECGTGPGLVNLLRLRDENCTHHYFAADQRRLRRARDQMLRAFCPRSARWRTTYVQCVNIFLERALRQLSAAEAGDV